MEGKEGGKGRMISWIWVLIAWVVGDIMGMLVIIICMGCWDKAEEKEKAADAGTSTAAHEAQKGNLS